ncbi:MAG: hypothetical protein NTW86_31835 [Candidatus Sumerlaeota bacterium]|nr:hypothetical protein [Candidatus Sumerlaeota bacterium]
MSHELEIEVFRAGDYGPKGAYDEATLDALAADYSPALHEAPVTLDHNSSGPAFGWVASLRRQGDRMLARFSALSDELLGLLRAGAYKKRSIELYRAFPQTGRPYLRAVSFLGACPPEVKGLADPVFAEGGPTERIWFEEAAGEARAVVSEETARGSTANPPAEIAVAEPSPAEPRPDRRAEIDAFCEALRRQGRFLPRWDGLGIREFMHGLAEAEAAAFAEGPERVKGSDGSDGSDGAPASPLEWFQEFLAALPPLVPLGEAAPDSAREPRLAFRETLPRETANVRLDGRSVSLHRRALALRGSDPGLTYAEALRLASP